MSDSTDNMVLRTLYLPRDLDQALKSAALRGARSKGDVIRELIYAGLKVMRADPDSYFAEPSSPKKPVQLKTPNRSVVAKAKSRAVRSAKKVVAA
ncbi:hypothetical protein RFM99_27380 [Mesorhizobium sp. VK4C]|uniref:hypothetical protein n=1 Tax=Mesorhizobium captivum TaxID=3072319 RepID=UPI002A24CA3A|nr:hypothetical protein [Mesorhizobium sp. VK4C]MDX8502123.1 hypothetical protein [Mesorhizobium sp. VK4C]